MSAGPLVAFAQDTAPVTVLDSPLAWQLLQQAEDQAKENPSEAARLCQKLLDGYSDRVIPAEKASDDSGGSRFQGVAERVEQFLRAHPSVLDRYRQMEEAEAERMVAFDAPERVASTRGMTRAGLRANLRIAERDLLAGHFGRAQLRLARVEGHPDLSGDEATVYWYLRGATAALSGNVADRQQAEARLRALGLPDDAPQLATVARFAAIGPRETPPKASPLSQGIAPDLSEASWQPVWSEVLDRAPFGRLLRAPDDFGRIGLGRRLDQDRYDGKFLVVSPVVHGDIVYLSDGDSVIALDRLSHREVWQRPLENGRIEQDVTAVSDLSVVAVGDGVVITLPGHSYINERGTTARITCLNAADGTVRWETPLAMLPGTEFEDLFPLGAPVIADGSVYCMARKLTSRLETVDYLLALALDTGAMRFATYIAGAGGVNMQGLRPASTPLVAHGSVFVASSAGAFARIDAADGHIQWLQRFLVPVRNARYQSEPWEMGGPALVGEWIFAIAPNLDSVVQLHRETGRIESTMAIGVGTEWGTPRYLLADDGGDLRPPRIFAVGGDLVAIDPDRPNTALWKLSDVNGEAMRDREGSANRAGIRGRVQCAGATLVVPGLSDVLLVARETGRIQERIVVDGPSNPVLVGPQLLLGLNNGAMALMPAASAERLMRERIAKDPNDPEGGLALLDLGLRSKRLDLSVEAARSAKTAIEQAAPSTTVDRAREELVVRLLRVASLEIPEGDEGSIGLIESAHALLAATARTPSQLVRQLLAWGDWLAERKRWQEAIQAVDAVLANSILASEPVDRVDEVSVVAATEAIDRLRLWEKDAEEALAQRSAQVTARRAAVDARDPRALAQFAIASVMTDASVTAAIDAANGFVERKAWRSAWATIQGVLRTIPKDERHRPQVSALVSAAVNCARLAGWNQTARSFADTIFADFGDLELTIDGITTTINAVRNVGLAAPGFIGSDPGEVKEVRGRLVRVAPGAEDATALKGVLFSEGSDVVLRRLPDFERVWSSPIVDRDPIVLDIAPPGARVGESGADAGAILLWQAASDREAFASWISLRDGSVITRTPAMGDLLTQEVLLEGGRPVNQQMPNELPFVAGEVIPLVTSTVMVVARRNGDLIGFDRSNLSTVQWRKKRVLDQVYEVGTADWGIALAGRAVSSNAGSDQARTDRLGLRNEERLGGREESGEPTLVLVDPATGELFGRVTLEPEQDVAWMRLLETGEVLLGAAFSVLAYDALPPQAIQLDTAPTASPFAAPLRWKLDAIATHNSVGAWRVGGTIVLAINTELSEAVVPIELATAREVSDRFRSPLRLDNRTPELRAGSRIQDQVVLRYRDRIVAFDLQGEVSGEDAVADDDRDFAALLQAKDSIVVISNGLPRQIPMTDGSGLRFEYSYMLYRLSATEGCRLLGPGIRVRTVGQRGERWALVDGYVIVSTSGGSLAVPLP
ncbi:MAG: PQQ-binding-like beta-propeller repeat protein [Phycisphaerae bacterium]|jgi:outer membrane protein assembly factor BamB|nr:PQQ-binding-like beta-propeller repeat protein [Phycisphaerae bacterium]